MRYVLSSVTDFLLFSKRGRTWQNELTDTGLDGQRAHGGPMAFSARFSDEQFELLDKTASDLDVSMAGLLRMLVDGYMPKLIERERKARSRRQGNAYRRACDGKRTKKKVASGYTDDLKNKLLLRKDATNIEQKKREVNKGVTCGSITKRLTPPRR